MILTYINNAGLNLTLTNETSRDDPAYYLTGFEGGHGITSNLEMVEQYAMDGALCAGQRANFRNLNLSGLIVSHKGVAGPRLRMERVFTPKGTGLLILKCGLRQYEIACVVERAPFFAVADGSRFTIGLVCPDPYWRDVTGGAFRRHGLSGLQGQFQFAFQSPVGVGFEFGVKMDSKTTNVLCESEIETGFVLTWSATGVVVNPTLIETRTGKFMRFILVMDAGDTLIVDTRSGRKKASFASENAMKYLDIGSVFLMLKPGDNPLHAKADMGGAFLDTNLSYERLVLGV